MNKAVVKTDTSTPEHSKQVVEKYMTRFSLLKKGQEYSKKEEHGKAVEHYLQYLKYVADYHRIEEKKIRPSLFDLKKDLAEMLLISHVYWDLAKAYDRSPRMEQEARRCLSQFLLFSIGFKYQYLNSEMMRRYMRKKISYNPKMFEEAYQQLKTHAKSCYVCTYIYGPHAPETEWMRGFRDEKLNSSFLGRHFVQSYYSTSPRLLVFIDHLPRFLQTPITFSINLFLKGLIFVLKTLF